MYNQRRLFRGEVVSIRKTPETRVDEQGETWTNCIFTVKLTGLPKGATEKAVHREWIGKTLKLKRWCCYNWHYKESVRTTIDEEEFAGRLEK